MNPIFKKLNYKDHAKLYVLHAPENFEREMEEMRALASISTNLTSAKEVVFFLAFVTKQKEVDDISRKVIPLLKGDGVLWFAYPKKTSKKYTCEFNRDTGWTELGKNGFEGVRIVAIDEDWSALRFRKTDYIKSMIRGFAISEAGKKKVMASKKSHRR